MSAKPLPIPNVDTRPYWEGATRGELMYQQCGACKENKLPARNVHVIGKPKVCRKVFWWNQIEMIGKFLCSRTARRIPSGWYGEKQFKRDLLHKV